jgi:hypothetical protein
LIGIRAADIHAEIVNRAGKVDDDRTRASRQTDRKVAGLISKRRGVLIMRRARYEWRDALRRKRVTGDPADVGGQRSSCVEADAMGIRNGGAKTGAAAGRTSHSDVMVAAATSIVGEVAAIYMQKTCRNFMITVLLLAPNHLVEALTRR